MTPVGARPGVDPIKSHYLMENHDEAYQIWRKAGVRDRILVHLDAHDDVWWLKDQGQITIANFICPALKEGLVREVYWVVPDKTWENPQSLKPVLRHLKKIIKKYSGKPRPIQIGPEEISVRVLDKPLRVCPLGALPHFPEAVLLDIDVDYLVIPRACHSSDQHRALPWCWPEDLVARLNGQGLRTDLVTIAYSVEGGYTPLKWKYLGDELAQRLAGYAPGGAGLKGMGLMREAALAAHRGDRQGAEARYLQARELMPDSPAPNYHLAQLYVEMGRNGDSREYYQRALALDPSYRTPYNSGGNWYYADRRYREAEAEHRRILALDPEDAYAHLGLGQVAAKRKQWQAAEAWCLKALELNSQLVDGYRTLGLVRRKQGRLREAIAAYEKSLQLSLAGHKPLGPILTVSEGRLLDPEHFKIHAILARLYERLGDADTAITGYRMGMAKGYDGFWPRWRLASLYLKQGRWQLSLGEAWQALQKAPGDVWWWASRHCRRLKCSC
jgi:tetratricopeptide (TPR) repeat protein